MSQKYDLGMKTRREVPGDDHVDCAEVGKSEFDLPFQAFITKSAWATIWSSGKISRRERSRLTLALLATTGSFEEIPIYIRATVRTGASIDDVAEALQHVASYAGMPKANHALELAKQTYAEMDESENE